MVAAVLLFAALAAPASAPDPPPPRQCASGIGKMEGGPATYNCSGHWCNPEFSGPKLERCAQFPFPPDPTLDCELRALMLDFGATTILPHGDAAGQRDLYDALELGPRCGVSPTAGVGPPPAQSGFRPSARGVGAPGACGAARRIFHVSTAGNDTTGTGDAAAPFSSLWRAREAVRSQPRERRESTCVLIREGVYELEQTLRMTVEDGGASPQAPVTYTAAPGERVVLSGGTALQPEWRAADAVRKGAVVAPLPGERITSLFVEGRRQVLARHPNANPEYDTWPFGYATGNWWSPPNQPPSRDGVTVNFGSGGDGSAPSMRGFNHFSTGGTIMGGTNANRYSPAVCFNENDAGTWHSDGVCGEMNMGMTVGAGNWANRTFRQPSKAVVHTMMGQPAWGNWMFAIDSISQSADGQEAKLSFSKGGWQTAASDQGGPFDYFLEGQLELLDEPGEWLHDDEAGLLYLLPNTTDGAPPKTVVTPRLRELISIEGTQRSPVANLRFDGLTFAHTTPTFMEPFMVPGPGDWSIRQSGSVFIDGAENITFHRYEYAQPYLERPR